MTEYYHIVPWYNSEEWQEVYENLCSSTSTFITKQEALNLLLIWKARCPSLPSGIESTLSLLEVYLQDLKNPDDIINDQLFRLAYSSAIMRFVNHMLDTETAKGTSLYQAAKNLGVPEWIVDLRHDTAHSNILPSIELLREASLFGLKWLQENYWDKHKECIKDYLCGQREEDNSAENKITTLVNLCISLSICVHSKSKIKTLASIPDNAMKESIVNDARELFGNTIDFSNLKTVSVMSLINIMNTQSKKILKSKDVIYDMKKVLLGEESLFLSMELLNYLNESDFNNKERLNKHYLECFELLLTFLHTNELLLDFILELIKITQNSDYCKIKRKLVALWVSQILKALRKSNRFINKMNKINPEGLRCKSRRELKTLFYHWFPNEKNSGIVLNLHKSAPSELTDINFIKPIISSYNPYLTYFIHDLFNLVEPHLPATVTEKICNLAKLISSPTENFSSTSLRIYTVDDLNTAKSVKQISADKDEEDNSDCMEIFEKSSECTVIPKEDNEYEFSYGIWRLASRKYNWSTCPIGQLPWQQIPADVEQMEI